ALDAGAPAHLPVAAHDRLVHRLRLHRVIADDHRVPRHELDLVERPSGVVAIAGEQLDLPREHLRRAAYVPHVAEAREDRERLSLAAARDENRNRAGPARGRRAVRDLAERVAAVRWRGNGPAREQRANRRDRLREPLEPLPEAAAEVDPVQLVLELAV